MDKIKITNPFKWLKAKRQKQYKKLVNEKDDQLTDKQSSNEYLPKRKQSYQKYLQSISKGKGYKKKQRKIIQKQAGKGKKLTKRRKQK